LEKNGHLFLFEQDTRKNAFQGLDMSNDLKHIPMTSNKKLVDGFFWNPSYGCPWTIPKKIFKITTPFSSLSISFLS
jgi:hypothetical protein